MPGENWVRTLIRIGEGGSVRLGLSASGELTSVAAIVVVAPSPFDARRRGARWHRSDGLTWISARRRTHHGCREAKSDVIGRYFRTGTKRAPATYRCFIIVDTIALIT